MINRYLLFLPAGWIFCPLLYVPQLFIGSYLELFFFPALSYSFASGMCPKVWCKFFFYENYLRAPIILNHERFVNTFYALRQKSLFFGLIFHDGRSFERPGQKFRNPNAIFGLHR